MARHDILLPVARISIDGSDLIVRLNPLEVLMALRRTARVPDKSITSVEVVDLPLQSSQMNLVQMGFAASAAPLAHLATIGPRAKYHDGRALVIVWTNSRSVVVEMAANPTRWRPLIVSSRRADDIAATIRATL